jgi:hypothetical protein
MSSIPLSLLALLVALPCAGQEARLNMRRDSAPRVAPPPDSQGTVTPTQDMWFYEQEWKRHDDPKMAVRRRAELRAQERHDRLASLRWYGISNSRPTVSSPWSGGYSAYMGSNTYDPLRWRPMTAPVVLLRPAGGSN